MRDCRSGGGGRSAPGRHIEPDESERDIEQAPLGARCRDASGLHLDIVRRRPQPPARGQRRRVLIARVALEPGEAAVRVPDHEGGNPGGAGAASTLARG